MPSSGVQVHQTRKRQLTKCEHCGGIDYCKTKSMGGVVKSLCLTCRSTLATRRRQYELRTAGSEKVS